MLSHSYETGRVPRPNLVRRNIAGDNRSGADDRAVADGRSSQHNAAGAEIAIPADGNLFEDGVLVEDDLRRCETVLVVDDVAVGGNDRVITDGDTILGRDDGVSAHEDPLADCNMGMGHGQQQPASGVQKGVVAYGEMTCFADGDLDPFLTGDMDPFPDARIAQQPPGA